MRPIVTNTAINTLFEFPEAPSSIVEFQKLTGTVIYPNPTTSLVDIYFGQPIDAQIKVTDIFGRIALPPVVNSQGSTQLDLSSLSNGLYLIHIETKGHNETHRILKTN